VQRRRLTEEESKAVEPRFDYEWVEVTWGPEKYSPEKFFFKDIGPFTIRGRVQDGEAAKDAIKRLYAEASAIAKEDFEKELKDFRARILKGDDIFRR